MIHYLLLISRQGKLRMQKWYSTFSAKEKTKITKDLTQLALARREGERMCNFLEYKGRKIVYRRYASLFFVCAIDDGDNELATLEIIHRFVESLDKFFGNVCELDLIFNYDRAYSVLDELLLAGELQEPSRRVVIDSLCSSVVVETDDQLVGAIQAGYL